jgi:MFS family permease
MIVGLSLNTMVSVGMQSWGPAFFMRAYGWSVGHVAGVMGMIWLVALPAGAMLGGMVAERLARRGRRDANVLVTLVSCAANLPFLIAAPFMPNWALAATSLGIAMFMTSLHFGPQNAAIQTVTPNRMRGQVTALVLFGFNIIGYGIGPTVTALFTDYLFRDEAQVGFALASCAALLSPVAILIMLLGYRPYERAVAALEEERL